MRTGIGYDIHRLTKGRRLILGGVEIPYDKGLEGHSDADVLIHAICDAILGAAALGDIGQHFPDTDPQYKNIDSIQLLRWTWEKAAVKHRAVNNIDATIFAQKPKLAPYMPAMVERLAECLGISLDRINIKATTTEGLGLIGDNAAMAAMSVVTLE